MHEPPLILVVDDMPDNVEIVKLRLESEGYAVVTAVDGPDALVRTVQSRPDLILLDVMMPKLDGIEVVKRLKADATLPFTPIILLTAKADVKDVVHGLEVGADDYLTKPVDHPGPRRASAGNAAHEGLAGQGSGSSRDPPRPIP
jgi:adenylate cyclase